MNKKADIGKNINVNLDRFISIVCERFSREELDKCILECAHGIISTLRDNYTFKFVDNIPKNYQKNKIMNFDIIDYLKLNMVTKPLLEKNSFYHRVGGLYNI